MRRRCEAICTRKRTRDSLEKHVSHPSPAQFNKLSTHCSSRKSRKPQRRGRRRRRSRRRNQTATRGRETLRKHAHDVADILWYFDVAFFNVLCYLQYRSCCDNWSKSLFCMHRIRPRHHRPLHVRLALARQMHMTISIPPQLSTRRRAGQICRVRTQRDIKDPTRPVLEVDIDLVRLASWISKADLMALLRSGAVIVVGLGFAGTRDTRVAIWVALWTFECYHWWGIPAALHAGGWAGTAKG